MSTQPPLNRRFLPVPSETPFGSHKQPEATATAESLPSTDGGNDDKENASVAALEIQSMNGPSPPPIRQLPQSDETTTRSHRSQDNSSQSDDSVPSTITEFDRKEIAQAQDDASTPKPPASALAQPPRTPTRTQIQPLPLTATPRPRVAPQLIETTKHSNRGGQQFSGPVVDASSIPSDRSDTTATPTPTPALVPHHKLTIWVPPEESQTSEQGPKTPQGRPLDGRSDLLTPHDSRSSSLPPPLRPYRQGSMRPHPNTRMNTGVHDNLENSMRTGGFDGDKQLQLNEQWMNTPSGSTSDFPRNSSYSSTPSLSDSLDSSQADSQFIPDVSYAERLTHTRESCDERFSPYLLNLAAVAAEAQLQTKILAEQVESAFPNRDFCYETVSHWGPGDEDSRANSQSSKDFEDTIVPVDRGVETPADSDDESDDGFEGPPELPHEMLPRKESAQAKHVVDLGNGMLVGIPEPPQLPQEAGMTIEEVRAHEAELVRLRAEETFRRIAEEAAAPSFPDPFWTNGTTGNRFLDAITADPGLLNPGEDEQRDSEMRAMRRAAEPPMAGGDLVFRMCASPTSTMCVTDQRHNVEAPRATNGGGLWGGYCVAGDKGDKKDNGRRGPQLLETPLETPANERVDNSTVGPAHSFLPLTESAEASSSTSRPTHSRVASGGLHLLSGLDQRLQAELAKTKREEQIKKEYNDKFVTQVYNYLSLGWPLLAREYDEELSKFSGIDEETLRANDEGAATGYIGLKRVSWASEDDAAGEADDADKGKGVEQPDENSEIKGNARWRALKKYIHVWARQHPNLEEEATNWGDNVLQRKGSWFI